MGVYPTPNRDEISAQDNLQKQQRENNETTNSVPLEECNPAGDTNFTGVTVRRAEGQNKITVRVVEIWSKTSEALGRTDHKGWAMICS